MLRDLFASTDPGPMTLKPESCRVALQIARMIERRELKGCGIFWVRVLGFFLHKYLIKILNVSNAI